MRRDTLPLIWRGELSVTTGEAMTDLAAKLVLETDDALERRRRMPIGSPGSKEAPLAEMRPNAYWL